MVAIKQSLSRPADLSRLSPSLSPICHRGSSIKHTILQYTVAKLQQAGTMPTTLTLLQLALLVLLLASAIELALISSMVGYLHRSGANEYPFEYQGATYTIHSKPVGLLLNEGHTSNGAAGSGIIFSLAGLALCWKVKQARRRVRFSPVFVPFLCVRSCPYCRARPMDD